MALKQHELAAALRGKFALREVGSGRGPHFKFVLESEGRVLAYVSVGRHRDEIKPGTLANIARQLGVNSAQLRAMCACTISREEHLRLITT
jgi:hypothetical protein